jgi:transketolase
VLSTPLPAKPPRGDYVLADMGDESPDLILAATERLAAEGVSVRVVSFPSWELFAAQDAEYCESVLPHAIKARLVVEMGISQGWHRWVGDAGDVLGLDHFGASAPYQVLYQQFGFTAENVIEKARQVLNR